MPQRYPQRPNSTRKLQLSLQMLSPEYTELYFPHGPGFHWFSQVVKSSHECPVVIKLQQEKKQPAVKLFPKFLSYELMTEAVKS